MSSKPTSNYTVEDKQKRVITEFLSKYMYGKIYPEHTVITDKELQSKAIDVALPTVNGPEYHDIKVQASKLYINKPQPTFNMELLVNHNDQEHVGWFLRNDLLSHVYVLCWVPKAKVNTYGYIAEAEDIEELEVMFIDKQELKDFVNTYFYDEAMYQQARKMRAKGDTRVFPNDAMYFVYSPALNTKPVYLVMKRWALERCAYQHLKVTKDGVSSLM